MLTAVFWLTSASSPDQYWRIFYESSSIKKWFDLELEDIPMPTPSENEALIKVRYAGVCGSDITVYKGKHMTATVPTVLSHEILGYIQTLPEGYTGHFKVGQRVLMNP